MDPILAELEEVLNVARAFIEDVDPSASVGVATQRQAIGAEIAPWVVRLESIKLMLEAVQRSASHVAMPAVVSTPLLDASSTSGDVTITKGETVTKGEPVPEMSIIACTQLISDYHVSTIQYIQESHSDLLAQITPSQQTIEQLTAHNTALKLTIEQLQTKKIGLKAIIKDKQAQINDDLELINRMRFDSLEAVRRHAEIVREKTNISIAFDNKDDELRNLADRFGDLDREYIHFKQDHDTAMAANAAAAKTELDILNQTTSSQIIEMKREVSRLKDALTVAEDKVANAESAKDRLRDAQTQLITQSEVIRELEEQNKSIRQQAVADIEKLAASLFNRG